METHPGGSVQVDEIAAGQGRCCRAALEPSPERAVAIFGMSASSGHPIDMLRQIVEVDSLRTMDADQMTSQLEPIHRRGPGFRMRVFGGHSF